MAQPKNIPQLSACRKSKRSYAGLLVLAIFYIPCLAQSPQSDPLPSWNDNGTKEAIKRFVAQVALSGSKDFVTPAERIATFDNDGTLWVEQPTYTQLAFALDRVKALAPQHPEWKQQQPFKAVLEGDEKALVGSGEQGLVQIMMATHTGMTTQEFDETVRQWLATAIHPRFHRPYTECVYQPMLELLAYLRANGFKTYVASGGDVDFIRQWAENVYGIPPEQVIGSSVKTKFAMRNGQPVLLRLPQAELIDDKAGKPVGSMNLLEGVLLPPLAILMAISKCLNGRLPAVERG